MGKCFFFRVAHVSVPEWVLRTCTQRMGAHQSKTCPLSFGDPSKATSAVIEINEKTFLDSPRFSKGGHSRCMLAVFILSTLPPTPSLPVKRGEGRKKIRKMEKKKELVFKSQSSVIHPVYIHVCRMTTLREYLSTAVRGNHVYAYLGYL